MIKPLPQKRKIERPETFLDSRMSKFKSLSSLFRSTAKTARPSTTTTTSSGAAAASAATETSLASDACLKQYVSCLTIPSPSTSHLIAKRSVKSSELPSDPLSTTSPASYPFLSILGPEGSGSDSENETKQLADNLRSILSDGGSATLPDLQGTSSDKSSDDMLNIPFISSYSHNIKSQEQKEISRSRKQKWFKHNYGKRVDQKLTSWAHKIGANNAVDILGKLGYENCVEGHNALVKVCIEEARTSDDEDVKSERISSAFQLLKTMKEQGCQLEEEAYGPCLLYLIEMGMVDKFDCFSKIIKDDNPSSLARFGYYEMLLHIRMNNKEKIQELCDHISDNNLNQTINLQENYLLAFSEKDQKNELLHLLEIVDITKVSSFDYVVGIFKSLGRLSLESQAEKFLFKFKECDYGMENISTLISIYATSIPNLSVEDVILKFKNLHSVLEMAPSPNSYEKLILYSCELLKVHAALDVVDQICRENLTLSIDTLNFILHAIEKSFEFNLVQRVYSLICCHNLQPNNETFRSMINLRVKMKDFVGAFDMLDDLKKFNVIPTAGMYNAIMAGYFRKKDINGALVVIKKMELADIKPDSQTYSYLIANCDSEDQIIKYYEEAKSTGVQVSKQICMSLINAYAACGQFEKAEQVLGEVPDKNLNEVKSVLVSALASHGQMSDALDVYEEIKKIGGNIEPKAVICLIEHLQSKGKLSRLLKLLDELQEPEYWLDGCCRVILYCIRNKHLSSALDLLKQLNDRYGNDELAMQVIFDEVFSLIAEIEPTDLQIGLDLLQFIKDELSFSPSRKSLDFLLSTCAKAKDLCNSLLIWEEYQAAGYPYNVTSYLRMYQAVLASGDHKFAKNMLPKIPKDDLHVRMVIEACQKTYVKSTSVKEKKEKKKKEKNKL